ncbi:E3 ubiquitin-protein ligase TRIM7-like isoform X1 [Heteronotia binoei]|uniref:E3 ubiquitin-protein ligase TRIM7-like isoform X1 n=1 Tax=Heteronotia binoei TaxID=13085 RepID=UPI00292FF6AF|nr:E3 ubiquitin-protein ligase TRIM7-like isoform X1 [Heteronotia binoei]
MAAEGPVQELCEEASCSICLDLFRDPVTVAQCGHNFCRACLTQSWGEAGAAEPSCPQCRGPAQEENLRPNQQLASFVEIAKRFSPSAGKGAEAKGGEGEGGVCEKHREPLKFFCREDEAPLCGVCRRSREHRDHQVTPLEEEAQEKKTVVAARKEGVCQKHQKPLKLFCMDHEASICMLCEQSQEHQYHDIIPLEEASQEYKDQFCNCVEILRKERNKILAYKADILKESQDLLRQTKGDRQKMVIKFRQLQKFLEEEEELLLAQMEEMEKEVVKKRDRQLAKLSEELSSLESLIQEMEEKCQQAARDLLQDARRTLQKYEEKESFESPAVSPLALKWRVWDCSDFLEDIKKQFKDTLESGLHVQKANVTLDPDTAHLQLILSEDQKSMHVEDSLDIARWQEALDAMEARLTKRMREAITELNRDTETSAEDVKKDIENLRKDSHSSAESAKANVTPDPDTAHLQLILSEGQKSIQVGEEAQALPDSPERFDFDCAVLGREGFTGGCHFWEVLVGSEEEWSLGVARKSVKRKGDITFSPEEGFWEVGKWEGSYQVSEKDLDPLLTLSGELKRIRVCLNYAGGRVAFFDADRAALLYEFSGASFCGETLLPYFWVHGEGHLKISS